MAESLLGKDEALTHEVAFLLNKKSRGINIPRIATLRYIVNLFIFMSHLKNINPKESSRSKVEYFLNTKCL